jgi:hypothetical protein
MIFGFDLQQIYGVAKQKLFSLPEPGGPINEPKDVPPLFDLAS